MCPVTECFPEADASESGQSAVGSSGHTERRRRALPQLPAEARSSCSIGEKQDTEPQEKEGHAALKDRPPRGGHRATPTRHTPAQPAKPPARAAGERGPEDPQAEEKKPLVRQGSFTVEKPSTHVPQDLIPRIAQSPAPPARPRSDSAGSLDTVALLRDTEAVMAFLEARLRDGGGPETASTAAAGAPPAADAERKSAPKRRALGSLHKDKAAAPAGSTAREHPDRRPKPRPPAPPALRLRRPSLDLTDDDPSSSLPHSALSSDQEAGPARFPPARGPLTSTDELLRSKMDGGSARAGSGPRPRPTRTSLLRRARLGDASDTDPAEADRASVASEVSTTSSTSKQPSGRRALSRIDLLAQPRRTRQPAHSARSDSEAAAPRGSTRVSAETALRLGLRPGSAGDAKPPPRVRANSVSKLPDAKAKPPASVHSASPGERENCAKAPHQSHRHRLMYLIHSDTDPCTFVSLPKASLWIERIWVISHHFTVIKEHL